MSIKSHNLNLCLVLNARYSIKHKGSVLYGWTLIEQLWVQSLNYCMVLQLEIEPDGPEK